MTLTELFENKAHFMVTAHRGASYNFPENTPLAMQKAIDVGADMIEFDLRSTKEDIPVLLHDHAIDRTSDGKGKPEEYTLAELRKLNFSWFAYGKRLEEPFCDVLEIPTFEDILKEFRGKAAMNIQVYTDTEKSLAEACRLYREYDMYDQGYVTVTPERIDAIRAIDPEIELCVTPGWETRTNPDELKACKNYGARFVQPIREFSTPETFALIKELGLRGNVFMTDNPQEMDNLAAMGAQGVLTNQAELLCRHLQSK